MNHTVKRHLQVAVGVFVLVSMPWLAALIAIGWVVLAALQDKSVPAQKPEQPYEGLVQGVWRKLRAYW